MTIAGYDTEILLSGSGLALTNEACTNTTGDVFQITDAAKRALDPTAVITVKANGITVSPELYTLDRLFGRVSFLSTPAAPVTVSGTYLPMTAVATATGGKFSRKATNTDVTPLNTPNRHVLRQQILKDVSGSITRFETMDALFSAALLAGAMVVVQRNYAGAPFERAWVILESDDQDLSVDSVIEESIEFSGTTDADGRVYSLA